MVQNPESAERKSRTFGISSLPHASCGVGSRTLDKFALASDAQPLPDLRDAHAAVRQPAHGDSIEPRSRIQAGAESVAAPVVCADSQAHFRVRDYGGTIPFIRA